MDPSYFTAPCCAQLAGAYIAAGGAATGVALLFCPGDAVQGDQRAMYSRGWQTELLTAPVVNPVWCLGSCICSPCAQYSLRYRALGGNMAAYRCCQGYFDFPPCFQSGRCGDEGSDMCLLVEVCLCPMFAVQATRFYMMDTRSIAPSPTDNKLLRCSNFLQSMACLCEIAACLCGDGYDAAATVRIVADSFFFSLIACMSAQVATELDAERKGGAPARQPGMAPEPMQMNRQYV